MSEPTQPGAPAWPVETTVPDAPSDGRLAGTRPVTASEISADLAEASAELREAEELSSGGRTSRRITEPEPLGAELLGERTLQHAAAAPAELGASELAALERAAVAAQPRAYAPYSRFRVGAAVWGEGQQFSGVNVENASFGLTICAERNAVAHAVTSGVQRLTAVAVCTSASPPSSPCGSCRQVLLELADDPHTFRVIAVNPAGERREWILAQLLPDYFTRAELPGVATTASDPAEAVE